MIDLKVKETKSFKDKILGLIGKSKPESLLIKTRFGIHTFGVKWPIDVIILDRNYKVKYIKENLQPNRIFFWNPVYNIVIELPEGFIKNKKIELNSQIKLIFD